MDCCRYCKRKRKTSNPIVVESIATLTPNNHNRNEKLKELEVVFNEIISQLNNHYEFKVKTDEEALTNIHALVMYTAKKYDFLNSTNI